MKKIAAIILATAVTMGALASPAFAGWVNGYVKGNGTYVAPYYRTSPDGNPYNNRSYWR